MHDLTIIISINMSAEETEKSDSNTAGTCTNIDTTWLWGFWGSFSSFW